MRKIRNNNTIQNINLNMLVPKDHIVRKINSTLDLSFIYEKVKPLIAILLIVDNITPIMSYKRPMTKYGFFKNINMFIWNEIYTI